MSPVGMEYTCHKKAPKMLELVKELVTVAKQKCDDVELCAIDATRAESDFLSEVINIARESGVKTFTV